MPFHDTRKLHSLQQAEEVSNTFPMSGALPETVASDLQVEVQEISRRPRMSLLMVYSFSGSGYVERVGSGVTIAQPGDPVLLSFSYCNQCAICKDGCPAHCLHFNHINFDGKPTFRPYAEPATASGRDSQISGVFFGQSSFANRSIVDEGSVVNVKGLLSSPDDLKLLAPLGCGIQTGAGSITNVAAAQEKDAVAILGLGGVGMASIMVSRCQIPPSTRRPICD